MKFLATTLAVLLSASLVTAESELKLAKIFGDHMVLQQGKQTSIFGDAKAGADVTVEFAGQSLKTKADDNGHWSVTLEALKTNATGRELKISSGDQSASVKDILVGEVWMCSGQSNMAWTVNRTEDWEKKVAEANHPTLRLFTTATATAAEPQRDITSGEWKICTPETAPTFSAVGFFFGKELVKNLDTPIGLVSTAWGGKPSEAFTSRETLEETESAKKLLAEWDARQSGFNPEAVQKRYEASVAAWEKKMSAFRGAKKAGENPNPKSVGRKPTLPQAPNLQPNFPSAIYNRMIYPWNNYAIAGAIWYQGESNRQRSVQYETLFPAMIADWRKQRNDDFPFYFVQLANFLQPSTEPGVPDAWAELQNAQTLTLQKLPNTGMAIINDIGEAKNIHPKNKEDVGKRLARWALSEHYGKQIDGPVSGPIYKSHEIVDGGIRVHFDYAGEGLKSRDGGALKRFEIAGADQKWVWADAKIEDGGKSVFLSSRAVANPVAARYAWAANPQGANLVNAVGLPASLFRTDSWELSTAGVETLGDANAIKALANLPALHEKLRQGGWDVLFNGKDLTGWRNPYDYGEAVVKYGEIHLSSDKKFFLVTEKTYKDFILQVEIKLPEGQANSGVMFRAHVEPGKVYGYQAECDGSDRRWSGGLYDEGRRKWVWPSKEGKSEEEFLDHSEESLAHMAKPEVAGALKRNDWNKYTIQCRGNRIVIKVNNVEITNIKDDMDAEGYIGIQHHGEKGAIYKFRNIYLKPL
ncbi:MAG: DUF1080 domain-containing protein [Verrucomicrobiales bacterium]|nr:DUF1080 domain-containing protein [Verrucomicrobiales bacterium]